MLNPQTSQESMWGVISFCGTEWSDTTYSFNSAAEGTLANSRTHSLEDHSQDPILHTEHNPVYHPSSARPVVPNRGGLCSPRGNLAMSRDFVDFHDLGEGMGSYWHPMGRDQGCCWTSYTGPGQPHTELFSQNKNERPWLKICVPNFE